ncbi:hypothetical protein W911_16565 [Hyphomicrobium nitrativorans NL23]|uniref:Pentapeptide repeat-containing protein n=1 Tax=Hyphomicrobium nitrativorans NL23 TaxID=1029756 RepID=V5SI83_9HYPH|nr:hypothetical protein W911_16565 [Hyphomicrobium nitrativorans NL23]
MTLGVALAASHAATGASSAPWSSAVATENVSPEADLTAREVTRMLFEAKPGERVNYAGHKLTYLDLSGLDFKQATLTRTDLYGTDFTGSSLKGADVSGARLDRAVLIRADFSGANLRGATIFRPTVYSDLQNSLSDAPRFAGANLTGVRVQAELSGADFRGANLTRADLSPLEARPGQGTLVTLARNVLKSCDFSGATLRHADLTRTVLTHARLVGADLTGARLVEADLVQVDFSGADFTGADVTGADFDGANLAGVKGLDTAKGLDRALNLEKGAPLISPLACSEVAPARHLRGCGILQQTVRNDRQPHGEACPAFGRGRYRHVSMHCTGDEARGRECVAPAFMGCRTREKNLACAAWDARTVVVHMSDHRGKPPIQPNRCACAASHGCVEQDFENAREHRRFGKNENRPRNGSEQHAIRIVPSDDLREERAHIDRLCLRFRAQQAGLFQHLVEHPHQMIDARQGHIGRRRDLHGGACSIAERPEDRRPERIENAAEETPPPVHRATPEDSCNQSADISPTTMTNAYS